MKRVETILFFFLLAALLLAAGCAAKPAAADAPTNALEVEVTPTPTLRPQGKYRDGVYTAEAQGRGGMVQVSVTVADDKILEVRITGEGETRGVGTVAMERLPERILAAQSAAFDGVSGASITSEAVRTALKAALKKAEY